MMKKGLVISLFVLVPMVVLATPSNSCAQQPKLDMKVFVGGSVTTFVSKLETERLREGFAGWQIGFGPRIRRRQWFAEVLFSFNRWALRLAELGAAAQVNSFELPINAGYVPYKNPFFKLYLYAGFVNHFNTKIITKIEGGPTFRQRPKELEPRLAIYQALARFGVNADLAMFNVDLNYSISLNSATKTTYRTSYHLVQLNLAYLF